MNHHSKTKLCRGCGETKALADFDKNKTNKDGHQTRCKQCFKKYVTKPRHKMSRDFGGKYAKDKLDRDTLLKQISYLKDRESNAITQSKANFDFLFTNEKFSK